MKTKKQRVVKEKKQIVEIHIYVHQQPNYTYTPPIQPQNPPTYWTTASC